MNGLGFWSRYNCVAETHSFNANAVVRFFSRAFFLLQTMIRVKDAKKSLQFYRDFLGMRVLWQKDFEGAKFSLYMLAHHAGDLSEGASNDEGYAYMKKMFSPVICRFKKQVINVTSILNLLFLFTLWLQVLELTHNWGTEDQEDFHYHNGNTEEGGKGFGHTGYLVDNLEEVIEEALTDFSAPFFVLLHAFC